MPTAEAQLILSCKATGTAEVKRFNDEIARADKTSEKLLNTLGKVDRAGNFEKEKLENMRKVAESTKQLSSSQNAILNNLKKEKDLTNASLAELLSAAAARKAYNAEMKLSAAQKNLDTEIARGVNASKTKIQELRKEVEKLRLEYAKAAKGEADANMRAFTAARTAEGFNNVAKGAKNAAGATKGLSAEMLAARTAGRVLGVEIAGVSKELAQGAIIAKGAESAIKVFSGIIYSFNDSLKDRISLLEENVDQDKKKAESEKNLENRLQKSLDTLKELNAKEKLSSIDRLKVQNIVDATRKSFRKYGVELDIVNGKIKNLNDSEIMFSKEAKQKEESRLKNLISQLESKQKELEFLSQGGDAFKKVKTGQKVLTNSMAATNPTLALSLKLAEKEIENAAFEIMDFRNNKEYSKAAKDRIKVLEELDQYKIQLKELQKIDPEKNIRERRKAAFEDYKSLVAEVEKQKRYKNLADELLVEELKKEQAAVKKQHDELAKKKDNTVEEYALMGRLYEKHRGLAEQIAETEDRIKSVTQKQIDETYNKFFAYEEKVKKSLFNELSNKEKLIVLQRKLNDLQDVRAEHQKAGDESSLIGINSDIWDVQQQINQIRQREMQSKQNEEKARLNIWQEMMNAGQGFRQTAQQSVNSYSLEAMRLQSRLNLTPKIDPQLIETKKQTSAIQKIEDKLEKYDSKIESMTKNLEDLRNNLGVTSY